VRTACDKPSSTINRNPNRCPICARRSATITDLTVQVRGRLVLLLYLSLFNEITKGNRNVLSAKQSCRFEFAVDTVLVFQMAAPANGFGTELKCLASDAPLQGPIVLTHSRRDTPNCLWHNVIESEPGVGCSGATEPKGYVSNIKFRELDSEYTNADFSTGIVNVDASSAFKKGGIAEGSHSDFWYEESVHLLLSIVSSVRSIG
jgi:hypothetical protein